MNTAETKADENWLLRAAKFSVSATEMMDRRSDEDMAAWAARLHQKLRDIRTVSQSAIEQTA